MHQEKGPIAQAHMGCYGLSSGSLRLLRSPGLHRLPRMPRDTPQILWSLRVPEDPWGSFRCPEASIYKCEIIKYTFICPSIYSIYPTLVLLLMYCSIIFYYNGLLLSITSVLLVSYYILSTVYYTNISSVLT